MRNISCYGIFSLRGSLEAKTLQMYSKFWFQEAANFFTRLPEHQCVSHFSFYCSSSLSLYWKAIFSVSRGREADGGCDVVAAAVIPELLPATNPTRIRMAFETRGWRSSAPNCLWSRHCMLQALDAIRTNFVIWISRRFLKRSPCSITLNFKYKMAYLGIDSGSDKLR